MGFVLLMIFALIYPQPKFIQDEVTEHVRMRLAALGYDWVDVSGDGQEVRIGGTSSVSVDNQVIAALARTTLCPTAVGRMQCPTEVRIDIEMVVPPAPPPLPPPTSGYNHRFRFEILHYQLSLQGQVPSEDRKARLVEAAKAAFDKVVDELTVTGTVATVPDEKAFGAALEALALLVSGRADWREGRLGVTGVIKQGREEELQRLLQRFDNVLRGPVDLISQDEAEVCDDAFADRLDRSQISFATDSAKIRAESRPLLEELSGIAKRCPVTLQIEGHTDNVGEPEYNEQLSQSRAESVRKALEDLEVPHDRLFAVGFGPRRPVASNDNPTGRAKNRRIEIRIRR